MAYAIERIAEGHPLRTSLEALYVRRVLPPQAVVTLRGALGRVTLVPAPGSPAVPLGGPLYLVHATVVAAGDRLQILGTVSWSDQGLPRMAAGLLDDAVSAGVQVLVPLGEAPAVGERAPMAVAEAPVHREAPTRPERPRARVKGEPEDPQIDLSAEMASLAPRFDQVPAPDRPGSVSSVVVETPAATKPVAKPIARFAETGDLSADKGADKASGFHSAPTAGVKPTTRPAEPAASAAAKPATVGWGAAVAASRDPAPVRPAPSARVAEPADLGFDVDDPDLRKDDILIHPRFGRCRVVVPGDDKVKVRRPTGAFIDLHFKVCTFSRLPDEEGKRVFELRIGRKHE